MLSLYEAEQQYSLSGIFFESVAYAPYHAPNGRPAHPHVTSDLGRTEGVRRSKNESNEEKPLSELDMRSVEESPDGR